MKKFLALFLALAMLFSFAACSDGSGNSGKTEEEKASEEAEEEKEKAFDTSKEAYENLSEAYTMIEQYATDIYSAWYGGIYDDEEIVDDGISYLASETSLTEDEVTEGVAYFIATTIEEKDWDTMTDSEKQENRDNASWFFSFVETTDYQLFSACTDVINGAYTVSGKSEEIKGYLDEAKICLKTLSDDYSDYEHYPSLKDFYTTATAYFDFCEEPTGSFEQLKDTQNDYEKEARDYINDLDYIFEEE